MKVATSAVDQFHWRRADDESSGKVYLRKAWRLETTCPNLPTVFAGFDKAPSTISPDEFVRACGRLCRDGALYTPTMAQMVWKALRPRPITACIASSAPSIPPDYADFTVQPKHQTVPCWCALVIRSISLKSEEGRCAEALAALEK